MKGHWAIAYLLFMTGREPALRRWHRRTDASIWRRCGFADKPLYDTVHHHFALLEDESDAFRMVAANLIAKAVEGSNGMVGRDIHIDGTEAETHARLYHDCRPGETCSRASGHRHPSSSPSAKAPTPTAQQLRQELAEDVPGQRPPIDIQDVRPGGRIQLSSGCWYRTADATAGVRAYARTRGIQFWHGFNNMKAIDHYTGAVIATETVNASVNESDAYPNLLNSVIEHSGKVPRAVVGDRGFSLNSVYELNTSMGIASVFPWRKHAPGQDRDTVGTDEYDQHGIPLCQHCGAPGAFQSFAASPQPRLWFTCTACQKRGSVVCSKGWRFLVPLWRTSEAYLSLRRGHQTTEKAHWRWRDQWLVAPDGPSNRPRRRGIGCQTLRAHGAMLIEWLLVCYREGWLGGRRRNSHRPRQQRAFEERRRLLQSRQRKGLHLPRARRRSHVASVTRAGPQPI